MRYLDPDEAVRGYIKDVLEATTFPTPDGDDDLAITVQLAWPRKSERPRLPYLVVLPVGEVNEDDHTGDGDEIEDTDDQFEEGTTLYNHGSVEIKWSLVGVAQSDDVRSLLLSKCRAVLRSDARKTDSYEHYFNKAVSFQMHAYRRIESADDAIKDIYSFEIRGVGDANDVALISKETAKIITSGDVVEDLED